MQTDHNRVLEKIVTSLSEKGYRFLAADGSLQADTNANTNGNAVVGALGGAATGMAFGLVGVLSGGFDYFKDKDEELKTSIKSVASLGLLAGFATIYGSANIVLFIDCSQMGDEVFIGRFAMLVEKAVAFRKYSFAMMRTWLGDSRLPVRMQPYLIFTEAYKADYFMTSIWSKCTKMKFWRNVHIAPWIVDIPGKRLFEYRGLLWGYSLRDSNGIFD